LSRLLQIQIGNARYNCPCNLRQATSDSDNSSLIVGLCVGLGLLLLIVIVGVVVACRRRHKQSYDTTTPISVAFSARNDRDGFSNLEEEEGDRN